MARMLPGQLLFNPNSEIQTGKMTQDLGAETNRKNRGIPEVVCRDFFNSFMPKRLRQIAGFNFGFRVKARRSDEVLRYTTPTRPLLRLCADRLVATSGENIA